MFNSEALANPALKHPLGRDIHDMFHHLPTDDDINE